MNNKAHLRPKDYDSNGDIIPMACKEEKGDLISRKWLTDAIRNRRTYLSYEDAKDVIDLINNAPTVETYSEEDMKRTIKENFDIGYEMAKAKYERPQGEWVVQRLQSGFDDVYCPYCNARPTRSEYGYYLRDNFCHECGADMRKGGDEK